MAKEEIKEDDRFIGVSEYIRRALLEKYPREETTTDEIRVVEIEEEDLDKVDKQLVSLIPIIREAVHPVIVYSDREHHYTRTRDYLSNTPAIVVASKEALYLVLDRYLTS